MDLREFLILACHELIFAAAFMNEASLLQA
jgi:hypothetical protein